MTEPKTQSFKKIRKTISGGEIALLVILAALLLLIILNQVGIAGETGPKTSIRITTPVNNGWHTPDGQLAVEEKVSSSESKTSELRIAPNILVAPPVRLTQGVIAAPLPNLNGSNSLQPLSPNAPKRPETETVPLPMPNTPPITLTPKNRSEQELMTESDPQKTFLRPGDVLGPQGNVRTKNEIVLPDGTRTVVTEENAKNSNSATSNNATPKSNQIEVAPNIPNVRPENQAPVQSLSGNFSGMGRRKDGSMIGNPYAGSNGFNCQMKEYYPGQRMINTFNTQENRSVPPIEAYGTFLECPSPFCSTGSPCASSNGCSGNIGDEFAGNFNYYNISNDPCMSNGIGMDPCMTNSADNCAVPFADPCINPWCRFGFLRDILQNMQFNVGVLGFRNTVSNVEQGNFGFDIGLNWSTPKSLLFGFSGQAGGHFIQSSSEGLEVNGVKLGEDRSQFFSTSGFFHRGNCWQLGAVYDSLNDSSFHYTLSQVRVELSKKCWTDLDFGFRGAYALDDELVNIWRLDELKNQQQRVTAYSWYSLFVRKYFEWGGEGMLSGGVTEKSDGFISGQIEIPISDRFAMRNSFNFIFSGDDKGRWNSIFDQTWNISASFVFYLHGGARQNSSNPLRPLFEIADNGSFLQGKK